MNDQQLRIDLLKLGDGDVTKAKAMYDWVKEPPVQPPPPRVADGVVLLDREVMGCSGAELMAIAQQRLADKQNQPQPPAPPPNPPAPAPSTDLGGAAPLSLGLL